MSDISVTVVLNAPWLRAWQRALTTSGLTKSPIHWQICNLKIWGEVSVLLLHTWDGLTWTHSLSLCEVILAVFDLTVKPHLCVCMNPVYSCVFKLCGFWPSLFLSASWPAPPETGRGVSWRPFRSAGQLLGSLMWGWSCRQGVPRVWMPHVLQREREGQNLFILASDFVSMFIFWQKRFSVLL